jgi:hypothetical protein
VTTLSRLSGEGRLVTTWYFYQLSSRFIRRVQKSDVSLDRCSAEVLG